MHGREKNFAKKYTIKAIGAQTCKTSKTKARKF